MGVPIIHHGSATNSQFLPRRLIPHNHPQPTNEDFEFGRSQQKCHHPVSISLEKQLPKPLLIPGGRVTVRKKGNKDSDVHWFPRYATSTPWKSWKQCACQQLFGNIRILWAHEFPDSVETTPRIALSTSVLPSNVHSQITLNLNDFQKIMGVVWN